VASAPVATVFVLSCPADHPDVVSVVCDSQSGSAGSVMNVAKVESKGLTFIGIRVEKWQLPSVLTARCC
jgi:hypothetical protein